VAIDHDSPEAEATSKERLRELIAAWRVAGPAAQEAADQADSSEADQQGAPGRARGSFRRRGGGCAAPVSGFVFPRRCCAGPAAAAGLVPAAAPRARGGPLREVRLLFKRSWRQVTRDRAANVSRAMSQVSSALVFSTIYWRMGK
jgi:hypothetical protein